MRIIYANLPSTDRINSCKNFLAYIYFSNRLSGKAVCNEYDLRPLVLEFDTNIINDHCSSDESMAGDSVESFLQTFKYQKYFKES